MFSFLVILQFPVAGQNLDSLYSIWKNEGFPDSIRIKALKSYIGNGYLYSDPDSAFIIAGQLVDYAVKTKNDIALATAYNLQGITFDVRSQFPEAVRYYKRSLAIFEKAGYLEGVSNVLNNLGVIYAGLGDYSNALESYTRAVEIDEKLNLPERSSPSLVNIGLIYLDQGDYNKGLEYLMRELRYAEKLKNDIGIAKVLSNIGGAYSGMGDFPKSLEYYMRAVDLLEKISDQQDLAVTLVSIGIVYQNKKEYAKGLHYLQKAIPYYRRVGDQLGLSNALGNIGSIQLKLGNTNIALENCKKSLELAKGMSALSEQKMACQCLYEAYKAIGNDVEALRYIEEMKAVDDSLKAEEIATKLQQMEFRKAMALDSIAKEKEALRMQKAHEKEMRTEKQTRNWYIGGGVVFLLMAGAFYFRWRSVRKSRDIIEKEKGLSDHLLHNILPEDIARELKEKGKVESRNFETVSIVFTDFKGFTERSAKLSAADIIAEVNYCFEAFDVIVEKFGVEKIKTIGDAYMAAAGLPVSSDDSVNRAVKAALEMQSTIDIASNLLRQMTLSEGAVAKRLGAS